MLDGANKGGKMLHFGVVKKISVSHEIARIGFPSPTIQFPERDVRFAN